MTRQLLLSTETTILGRATRFVVARAGADSPWIVVEFDVNGKPWVLNSDCLPELAAFVRSQPTATDEAARMLGEIATVIDDELRKADLVRTEGKSE